MGVLYDPGNAFMASSYFEVMISSLNHNYLENRYLKHDQMKKRQLLILNTI